VSTSATPEVEEHKPKAGTALLISPAIAEWMKKDPGEDFARIVWLAKHPTEAWVLVEYDPQADTRTQERQCEKWD
jgi:hypothetical protein